MLVATCSGTTGPTGGATCSGTVATVNALGLTLAAVAISSTCTANEAAGRTGSTILVGAVLLGVPLPPLLTPTPNFVLLDVLGTKIVLNEQILSTTPGGEQQITVNAVHLTVTNPATGIVTQDIVLASSECSFTAPPAPPTISVSKSASPTSRVAPGGSFTFSVVVTNTSTQPVTITALTDDVYGDLNGRGTCAVGVVIAGGGGTYTCSFPGTFTGVAGATQTDTVTATAVDAFGQTGSNTAQATVSITRAPLPIATQVAPAAPTLGDSFHDTASLGPISEAQPTPTGTVTFRVYGPGNATCTGTAAFTSTSAVTAVPLGAVSAQFTPMAAGIYRVIATYSGDANYTASVSACADPNEVVVVGKATIAVVTQVTPATLTLGGSFHDFTALTPPAGVFVPGGSVTFNVYGPGDVTCTGAVLFSSTNAVNATSTGAVSDSFTPTAAGTYRVIASFTGDANYNPSTSACNDPNETVIVNARNAPRLTVTKVADPASRVAPGGAFRFTVQVSNSSAVDAATITSVLDDIYGDLATRAGSSCGALIGITLAPGATSAPCSFTGSFTGVGGDSQTDTVTVTGVHNGVTGSATAQATMRLTTAPVNPPPVNPPPVNPPPVNPPPVNPPPVNPSLAVTGAAVLPLAGTALLLMLLGLGLQLGFRRPRRST